MNLDDFTNTVDESCLDDQIVDIGSSAMVDEVRVESWIIGPWNKTWVLSDIENMNILQYPRIADAFLSSVGITPHYFKFALKLPEKDSWMAEIEREHVSMHNLQVWDFIERQESHKPVGKTWVFRKNRNPANEVTE
ncbi:hypothetical protein O181_027266 [Austropuccinia psidii MF-1]|uniref:Reverse transcriptase Ty1/copia-type domain-containing protein n=1 Tax=Austropuccinia psidii MF-1 TaxID=1389203 RepID=A0A9Q3CS61_9BASI|nr:hypothetical protein [Austropuccinia psidii MF-1]